MAFGNWHSSRPWSKATISASFVNISRTWVTRLHLCILKRPPKPARLRFPIEQSSKFNFEQPTGRVCHSLATSQSCFISPHLSISQNKSDFESFVSLTNVAIMSTLPFVLRRFATLMCYNSVKKAFLSIILKIEIVSQITEGDDSNRIMNCLANHWIFYFSWKNKKRKK